MTLKASGRSWGCSVRSGRSCKRFLLPLTPRDTVRAPWLGGHCPASRARLTPALRYYGPIRLLAPNAGRGLSVPGPVCRHAPSPSTPESRPAAHTRCLTGRAGLAHFDGLAAPTGVTRLIRVRLSLRLAPSPSEASCRGSLPQHARSATWQTGHSKVNSFQFTRHRPVSLTHRRREEAKTRRIFHSGLRAFASPRFSFTGPLPEEDGTIGC